MSFHRSQRSTAQFCTSSRLRIPLNLEKSKRLRRLLAGALAVCRISSRVSRQEEAHALERNSFGVSRMSHEATALCQRHLTRSARLGMDMRGVTLSGERMNRLLRALGGGRVCSCHRALRIACRVLDARCGRGCPG